MGLSVPQSMILIHMCKLVWWPGVLDVEKMVLQEYTLLSVRRCVGLTMPCLVIMEPTLEITAPSMDTLVDVSDYGRTTQKEYGITEPQESLAEGSSALKTDPAYTEDNANLSEVVKAPEPVY